MNRLILTALVGVLAACAAPPAKEARLAGELSALARTVRGLEQHLDAKQSPGGDSRQPAQGRGILDASSRPPTQPVTAARSADSREQPSRFAILAPGKLTITAGEFPGISAMAASIAKLEPELAVSLILDYAKTTAGLARVVKMLFCMGEATRAQILARFRPAEIRSILDQQVVHESEPGAGATALAAERNAAPTNTTPESGSKTDVGTRVDAAYMPSPLFAPGHPAGRFQIAGYGQDRWRTIFDTATGVVYNYRAVDGKDSWIAITPPLARQR